MSAIVLTILTLISSTALAAPEPLTFTAWKETQVLEAQNQMLRTSARISQLKTGKTHSSGHREAVPLPNSRFRKASEDSLAAAERDLKRAQDLLETNAKLTIEDYIVLYLPTLIDNPEAIQRLSEKLSKDELADIFKGLMRKAERPDGRRATGAGTPVPTHAKAP